ncbi:MAG: polysaccharide pyruvyl transferase family protein [bacterium]
MKLGVIGWYGHSNFGDERMLYCIKNVFPEHDFLAANNWNDARDKLNELNKCDYILIGGGGLILRNIFNQVDFFQSLKRPFALIGVSIEANHNNMNSFFQIIKEKAEFILVRDKQSKKYLGNHYKVIVGPDLTFLCPFNIVDVKKDDICGLNLRYWFYWKAQLHGSYHNLMIKMNNIYSVLKNIYPLKKWEPDKAVEIIKRNFKYILPITFYSEKNAINDYVILSGYFKNVAPFFDTSLYDKIRYLVGMRYHSIVFAVQCGIPFISLSYQPKSMKFCSDIDLKMLSVDIFNLNELDDKINYIKENYQHIRNHIISYREKAVKEIKYIFSSISALIK